MASSEESTEGSISAYQTIDYGSHSWQEKCAQALQDDGVVVIQNVFADGECDTSVAKLVDHFGQLCPKVTADPKTWKPEYLPSGPREGMFHSLVANFPAVWEVRSDPRVKEVFRAAYSGLRGMDVTNFVSSMDGVNVRPPVGPFHKEGSDWAHLDQTTRGETFSCVQGQVVLSNTTACFRCSPKSHLRYSDLLDAVGCYNSKSQFCKFPLSKYAELRDIVEQEGGQWQVPVQVPRGSMILWLSSTVHSARLALPHSPKDRTDRWSLWRCVVYVCYRPKHEVDTSHLQKLEECFKMNRCTNHWGTKIFPKQSRGGGIKRHPALQRLMDNPELMYEIEALCPEQTTAMRELLEW